MTRNQLLETHSSTAVQAKLPQYERDGFLVLDSVLMPTPVDELQRECDRLVSEYDVREHPQSVFSTVNQACHPPLTHFIVTDSTDLGPVLSR